MGNGWFIYKLTIRFWSYLMDGGVRWFLVTPLPTNNMFSTTHQMTGPLLWNLCLACLICLSTFVCNSPLSHLSEHLCQMTEGLLRWPDSHLLSNHLAPLSPVVNSGRACQCVAHARILPGPQGSPDHTWPPPAPCSSVLCVWQAGRGTSEVPPCPQLPICCQCHQCALLARLLLSPNIWWENWAAMARYWARWLD